MSLAVRRSSSRGNIGVDTHKQLWWVIQTLILLMAEIANDKHKKIRTFGTTFATSYRFARFGLFRHEDCSRFERSLRVPDRLSFHLQRRRKTAQTVQCVSTLNNVEDCQKPHENVEGTRRRRRCLQKPHEMQFVCRFVEEFCQPMPGGTLLSSHGTVFTFLAEVGCSQIRKKQKRNEVTP